MGNKWTFEKKVACGSFTKVHLDISVADPAWGLLFPSIVVENLVAAGCDHGPILARLDDDSIAKKSPK